MPRTPVLVVPRSPLAVALLAVALAAQAAPQGVTFLLSEDSAAYQDAARQARAEIARGGNAVRIGTVIAARGDELARNGADELIVALGTRAAEQAATVHAPVLNALLPRRAFEALAGRAGRAAGERYSALYLDQPEGRQLDLVRAGLPGREIVGTLASEDSRDALRRLKHAARERRMRLIVGRVDGARALHGVLQDVLAESDVLLALPDAQVLNSASLQNTLLSAYRLRRPVIGYSAAFVRAGALAAVYSTPAQIGFQVGEIVRGYGAATGLPAPQYPKYFSVAVNERLARSLDLVLDDEAVLEAKLRRLEEQR